ARVVRDLIGLPLAGPRSRPVHLLRDQEPVRGEPDRAALRVPPDPPPFGLHLRDRRDALADPGADVRRPRALPDPLAADRLPRRRLVGADPARHPGDDRVRVPVLPAVVPRHPAEPRLMRRLGAMIVKEAWALLRDPKAR